jgi:phosphoglycerate kinase
MQTIDKFNFNGKRAIVRVDFNVPLDKKTFEVTDDTRIRGALPAIKKILKDGGSAILMSHLGRPDGVPQDKYSMKHVIPALEKLLGKKVKFADDCIGASAETMSKSLKAGEVLLLENLRFYLEEEGKPKLPENVTDEEKKVAKDAMKKKQKEFTAKLASFADCYLMMPLARHRAHASTALIADLFL